MGRRRSTCTYIYIERCVEGKVKGRRRESRKMCAREGEREKERYIEDGRGGQRVEERDGISVEGTERWRGRHGKEGEVL